MTSRRVVLGAATVVATVATAGSLAFSTVLGFTPCDLCWYQRILMYPLIPVLGVAAVENRPTVWRTGLLLSVPGALVAAYHSYIQVTGGGRCTAGGCTAILYPMAGGLLTIPRLSLLGFLLVTAALVVLARGSLEA